MKLRAIKWWIGGGLGAIAVAALWVAIRGALLDPAQIIVPKTVEVPVLSVRAGFDYDVELTEPTLIWPAGVRLEPGRALYTYAGSPVMHLRPYLEVAASKAGDATVWEYVTVDLSGSSFTGKPLWRSQAVPPAEQSGELSVSGGRATRLAGVDMPLYLAAQRDQADLVRQNLGFTQVTASLVITMDADVRAVVDGHPYDLPVQATFPVLLQPDGFAPEDLTKSVQTVAVNENIVKETRVAVPFLTRLLRRSGWLETAAGVSLLDALYLYLRRARRVPEPLLHPEHRKFKDWITEGTVAVPGCVIVQVRSLQGLVDLAIDMKKRVVFDSDQETYFVIDGEALYRYSHSHPDSPPSPFE